MQQEFEKQQLLKQQQGFEMRQQQQNNAMPGGPANVEDLPPNFQHCSLKGRPFTPTMDLSIHNTQGIDVWVTKGPRPFGSSGTLPRTAIKKAAKSGELPPQPAKPQQQQQAPAPAPAALAVPQVAICPATPAVNEQELIVSSQKQTSSSTVMSSSSSSTTVQQQGGVNSVDLEEQKRLEYEKWFKTQEKEQQELEYDCSVKYEATTTNTQQAEIVQTSSVQEVATHSQTIQNNDEVDRAKKAAEEQQRLEQEKREMEMRQEQQRMEQLQREQELKEQQLREQQQRENELKEQQRREQEQREQEIREQQRREQERLEEEQRQQQLLEQQKREQEAREQQLREQQMREQQMREEQQRKEQELREQQMREQQMKEQQMREQQMKEQQMREQQMREQQMREQQMREQQMREQQMREQQMREQQMQQQQMQQQQQQFQQQQQMSMSRTTTQTSSFSQQQNLQQSNLSMQVKSGGFMSGQQGGQQQIEDYTSSLKPTSEGELIRTQGDLQYTQSSVQQQQMEQVQLRSTGGAKDIKDNIRQSGVFVGIAGDLNALVADGNEKHSVQDIVKHFSKIKPGDMPQQMMPQHYLVQQPPSLSELQEQAKERQFSYQKKDQVDASSTLSHAEQQAAEEKAKLFERRTSLKEYLLMDGEKSQQGNQIIDPSNILQVDGSVEGRKLYQNGARRTASGRELDSQGRLIETDKWDNHNAIARGWKTVEDNYHPVTFRKIYGVEKQAPTPVPMMRQATPNQPSTPAPAPQQVIPAEEQEAVSDL